MDPMLQSLLGSGAPSPALPSNEGVQQARDRITEILNRQSNGGSMADVGLASIRAAGANTGIGPQLQAIEGPELGRAQALYSLLRGERQDAIGEQQLMRQNRLVDLSERKQIFDMYESALKRGDEGVTAYQSAVSMLTQDPQERAQLILWGNSNPTRITKANAAQLAAQGATELKLKGTKPPTGFMEGHYGRLRELELKKRRGQPFSEEEQVDYDLSRDATSKFFGGADSGFYRMTPGGGGGAAPAPVTGQPAPPSAPAQVVPPRPQPLPAAAQGDMTMTLGTMRRLSEIETGLKALSIPVAGKALPLASELGLTDKQTTDALAAINRLRVDAQALIKGIPSNFDVQTFIKTLPQPGLALQENEARLKIAKEMASSLISDTIAFYKGSKFTIPPRMIEEARSFGIDPDAVVPWDGRSDPLQNSINRASTKGAATADPLGIR